MSKQWRRKLRTFGVATVASLAALATIAHAQDKSLRQEREEKRKQLIQLVENKGRCIGYFDVSGNAAEVLELKSGLPKQDVRAFVEGLAQYGQAFGQLAIGYGIMCEGEKQCVEAVVDANERGLARGRRDASTENVDAVKAGYVDCAKLFGFQTAMSPSAPPAPSAAAATEIHRMLDDKWYTHGIKERAEIAADNMQIILPGANRSWGAHLDRIGAQSEAALKRTPHPPLSLLANAPKPA